jgi:5'-3' exoribonuclease 2
MGVFPAGSRSHVPAPWGELMIDPHAPIIDFYPEDFKIDLNGKKFAWQVSNSEILEDFETHFRIKYV